MIPGDFYLRFVNPLRGLDEYVLASLLEEGERGAYATLQWLYRFLEKRNSTARAVKRRLVSALGGLDWDIKTVDCGDDQKKQALADRQAETLRAAYERVTNLRAALSHLALAELRGFAHCEKIYAGTGALERLAPWDVIELRVVDQWFWVRDGLYAPWQYNRAARQGTWTGQALPLRADGRLRHFIVREVDDPANEIIAKAHIRQEVADGDWDGFLESYGIPPMFIEGPPNVSPEREKEYQATAEKAVSAAKGYLPNGSRLHTPSATGSGGTSVFRERCEYLDGQIVIAGTSGKLTVLTESGSGTLAGDAQKQAFDEIAQAIAMNVSEAMQRDFDADVLARLHPGEPALAYFEFCSADDEASGEALDDAVKATQAGYAIDTDQLSERSGYKLTRTAAPSGAERSRATAAPAPVAGPPAPAAQERLAPAPPAAAEPPAPALPQLSTLNSQLSTSLGVTPEYLAPAQTAMDDLLAKAADGELTNDELLASAEDFLAALPGLAAKMDATGIAAGLEAAMRKAAEETLQPA